MLFVCFWQWGVWPLKERTKLNDYISLFVSKSQKNKNTMYKTKKVKAYKHQKLPFPMNNLMYS